MSSKLLSLKEVIVIPDEDNQSSSLHMHSYQYVHTNTCAQMCVRVHPHIYTHTNYRTKRERVNHTKDKVQKINQCTSNQQGYFYVALFWVEKGKYKMKKGLLEFQPPVSDQKLYWGNSSVITVAICYGHREDSEIHPWSTENISQTGV